MEKKITKRDNFASIVTILNETGHEDLAAVIENEIALLDRKAEKAKERAANKKAEADELMDAVQAVLTDELTVTSDIAAKIDVEGVSNAKVQNRLNKLVKAGLAVKEQITVGEGQSKRKLMAYKIA